SLSRSSSSPAGQRRSAFGADRVSLYATCIRWLRPTLSKQFRIQEARVLLLAGYAEISGRRQISHVTISNDTRTNTRTRNPPPVEVIFEGQLLIPSSVGKQAPLPPREV